VGLVLLVLVPTAFSGLASPRPDLGYLTPPIGLIGLISLPIGYRLYLWRRDQAVGNSDGRSAFGRATIQALAITAGTGVAGAATFAVTGEIAALLPVAGHLLLAGAIWPSSERMESFLDG